MRSIKDDARGLVAYSGAAGLGWVSLRFDRNGGGCSFGALAASFESSVGSAALVAPTAFATTGADASSGFGLPKAYFIEATLARKARSSSSSAAGTVALSAMPLEDALKSTGLSGTAARSLGVPPCCVRRRLSDDSGGSAGAPPPPNRLPMTECKNGWSGVDSLAWSTIDVNQSRPVARASRARGAPRGYSGPCTGPPAP